MLALTKIVQTFPSAKIPSLSDGLPVEVSLIAQLGHGAGDQLFESAMARQQGHEQFVDDMDEPSARLGSIDLARGDPTSLYSFGVGSKGHPFHRHAGHRVFTAISGSGGAQLRFSSASREQIDRDPSYFLQALRYVDVPPDSLFTVRFGGDTWHQFAPLNRESSHPALFAVSCHTNELGGRLPESLRSRVVDGAATIPSLTELLPSTVTDLMRCSGEDSRQIPTIALSLDAPMGSIQSKLCAAFRSFLGGLRGRLGRWRSSVGFLSDNGSGRHVDELKAPPQGSLLCKQFAEKIHHEDMFAVTTEPGELPLQAASVWLERLLEGFLENRPIGVSRLMALRNALVKPLGLLTSPLGCPVSSLLCVKSNEVFSGRFPVVESCINSSDTRAQVILGADDKHLRFRSCAGVECGADGRVTFTLGTRVQCKNLFGRFYMAAINAVHRNYVTPAMLRLAVDYAAA